MLDPFHAPKGASPANNRPRAAAPVKHSQIDCNATPEGIKHRRGQRSETGAGSVAPAMFMPRSFLAGSVPSTRLGQEQKGRAPGFGWKRVHQLARCATSGLNGIFNGSYLRMISEFATKLKAIRREIREEYMKIGRTSRR